MAQKKKATKAKAKATSSSASVTRVRAVDSAPVAKKAVKAPAKAKPAKTTTTTVVTAAATTKKRRLPRVPHVRGVGIVLKPFTAFGRYVKGAWVELKQVRWPTRRATWGMTGAVLLYSAFFTVIILLLDAGFKYLFELILSK